ncbi:PhzF family phenazine biosynthesis protein [Streptomyces sp. NBC_01565]|uniref:PhzF family phenazine biosynthesis protein n=1 Tax=unclassified Streptomyces TaxID=2593676 RepID=UPI0022590E8C|nr:PhzF family phenazine biosynthesis protein [Streptomyces sp. NBC_01565]MCX4545950.1 PhzF family phenazine biosynthesis protein [Streptomyces sp. NBC_01565]
MRIYVVDAFTDRPFAGNPAAVCLLPAGPWPGDAWMRGVAAEMNHSETAFALPLPAPAEADWAIRWFTPLVESTLCGHATLATAHVLRGERGLAGTVRFLSRHYGVLLTHAGEGERTGITLDFPAIRSAAVPAPHGLSEALGVTPEATFRSDRLGDLLTVLPDEVTVRAVAPDMDAVAALTRREGLRSVIVTAAAAGTSPGYDFVSRFFAPARGISEDPVTGSAHTVLAPYWSQRLGRNELTGHQASARAGLVRTAVHHDRVHLTGNAVTVLEGTLRVQPGTTV